MQYRDLIAMWPSKRALALDIGAKLKTVELWHHRDSIPASWWLELIKAADRRGISVSSDTLVRIESETKRKTKPRETIASAA